MLQSRLGNPYFTSYGQIIAIFDISGPCEPANIFENVTTGFLISLNHLKMIFDLTPGGSSGLGWSQLLQSRLGNLYFTSYGLIIAIFDISRLCEPANIFENVNTGFLISLNHLEMISDLTPGGRSCLR